MSRFHQRLDEDMRDPEFAAAFDQADVELQLILTLDSLRKQLGLTNTALAQRMGRRRQAVSRLLNAAEPNPWLNTLVELLAALGVTVEVHIRRARDGEPPVTVDLDVAAEAPQVPA